MPKWQHYTSKLQKKLFHWNTPFVHKIFSATNRTLFCEPLGIYWTIIYFSLCRMQEVRILKMYSFYLEITYTGWIIWTLFR